MNLIRTLLVAAIPCLILCLRGYSEEENWPEALRSWVRSAVHIECTRHGGRDTFTLHLEKQEEIAEFVKSFDLKDTSKPVTGTREIVHCWVIRVTNSRRRTKLFRIFARTKVTLDLDEKLVGELSSDNLYRYLTERASQRGVPDPTIPSLELEVVASDKSLKVPLGRHQLLLHASEQDLLVAEDGTDALLVYGRSSERGNLFRLQVFQDQAATQRIEKASPRVDMRGPYAMAQSPDGKDIYLACQGSGSICGFRQAKGYQRTPWSTDLPWGASDTYYLKLAENGKYGAQCSVSMSPDGNNLYVVTDKRKLVAFRRSAETGALTLASQREGVHALGQPTQVSTITDKLAGSVCASSDGRSVYVTAPATSSLIHFARDANSGLLTQVQTLSDDLANITFEATSRGLTQTSSLALSDDGANLYVCSLPGSLSHWRRDPSSGHLEFVGVHINGQKGVWGLAGATQVVAVPKSNQVCVVGSKSGGFARFERTKSEGLKFVKAYDIYMRGSAAFAVPSSIVVSSDLRFFYLASGANSVTALGVVNDPYYELKRDPK